MGCGKAYYARAAREFFDNNCLLRQLNATALVLLSKVDNPNRVTDYRPLACCGIIYKIIAKVLANRLQKVLHEVIDEAQGAFVKDRSMSQNILLSQELMLHYTRANSSPRCTIKLDLHKAYDSMNWSFIEGML